MHYYRRGTVHWHGADCLATCRRVARHGLTMSRLLPSQCLTMSRLIVRHWLARSRWRRVVRHCLGRSRLIVRHWLWSSRLIVRPCLATRRRVARQSAPCQWTVPSLIIGPGKLNSFTLSNLKKRCKSPSKKTFTLLNWKKCKSLNWSVKVLFGV